MKQYKVKVTIESEKKHQFQVLVTDIEKDEYLYFVEKDDLKTVNIFDYKNNILKRDNEKIYLELKFEEGCNTKGRLHLKDIDQIVDLDLYTEDIKISEENIYVNYKLNNEKYLFTIEKED